MDKRYKQSARPLSAVATRLLAETFAKQGFASTELVTRWPDIVGPEIAAHAEPIKMQWARAPQGSEDSEPATLVLRVEGPAAIEIQHLARVILDRVNRFFGYPAAARLAIRQAPLKRRERPRPPAPDRQAAARIAESLPAIEDEDLRQALGRLGAAIKRT